MDFMHNGPTKLCSMLIRGNEVIIVDWGISDADPPMTIDSQGKNALCIRSYPSSIKMMFGALIFSSKALSLLLSLFVS